MPTASFTDCDCCPGVVVPPDDDYIVLPGTCCVGGSIAALANVTADFGGVGNTATCTGLGGPLTCDDWNTATYEINDDTPCHRVHGGLDICSTDRAHLEASIGGTGAYAPGSNIIELVVTETTDLYGDVVAAVFYYPIPDDCRIPKTISLTMYIYDGRANCDWSVGTAQMTFTN